MAESSSADIPYKHPICAEAHAQGVDLFRIWLFQYLEEHAFPLTDMSQFENVSQEALRCAKSFMTSKIESVMSKAKYGSVTKYRKAIQSVKKRCLEDCMKFYHEYSTLIKQTLNLTQQLLSKNRTDGEKRHLERELEFRKPLNDRLVQEVVDGAIRLGEIAEKEKAEKKIREKSESPEKDAFGTANKVKIEVPKVKSLEMESSMVQEEEKGRSKNNKTPKKSEAAARRPLRLKQYYHQQELQRRRAEESKAAQVMQSKLNDKPHEIAGTQESTDSSSFGKDQSAVLSENFAKCAISTNDASKCVDAKKKQ